MTQTLITKNKKELTTTANGEIIYAEDQGLSAELINDFIAYLDRTPKTTKTYLCNLKQFFVYLQANNIANPSRQDIINFREYLSNKGLKANTITTYLQSVKAFFAWTDLNGYYPNIAQHINSPKIDRTQHKKDAFTVDEIQDIASCINNLQKAVEDELNKDNSTLNGYQLNSLKKQPERLARLKAIFYLTVSA